MKKLFYIVPATSYYILIFWLSYRSYGIHIKVPSFDKGIHCLEFAGLAFLLSLGYFKILKSSQKVKALITIFSGILLGVFDEFHQYFVPVRSFEILDMMADCLGIIIGFFLYLYISHRANF